MNIPNTPPTTPTHPPDISGGDIPVGKIFATDDAHVEAFAAAEAAAQRRAGLTDLETKRFLSLPN
ncbi:hypothetical protein [Thalassobius sp. Cn5-15]|uniref:hypothetical protein n=1 Tax=Thalassobius sp. Cn5-15 TaxID=2917763 RepID=UPI001EF2952D|nr:hypothetical protein [Thalassobius sp. Cn5-15]MCG7494708.1 hypothetical protein [Thalassobius sp. Cn5-15]